ncbi:MAG: hypothetical protein ACRCWM_04905 [Sarcina sp.]
MDEDMNLNEDIKKNNFKISKNVKIFSGAIIAVIVIIIIAGGFYRYENTKFFNTVNTNIATLDNNIASFKTGLNQNAEFLNPSFITTYETNFKNLASELQSNTNNFFNNTNSKNVINREVAKAQYYDYMAQFAQEIVNQKSNFEPLVNIMNKGGKLTPAQVTSIQNAISTLTNSKALTEAMNVYNTPNAYMNMTVKSPYQIKQKLLNLSNNLSTLDFKVSNTNAGTIWIDNII